jgi:hypothetical protein
MKIITVEKSAMKEVLKLLGYDVEKINIDEIAGIVKEGLVKNDIISLIELADEIKEDK